MKTLGTDENERPCSKMSAESVKSSSSKVYSDGKTVVAEHTQQIEVFL